MLSPEMEAIVAKVAVIEDDELARESLALYFEAFGHETRAARDGLSGLELVTTWRPDAVVCDVGLPDIDGLQVVRRIRQLPGLERTRVVAFTACADDLSRRRGLEAGFDLYIGKPADPGELIEALFGVPESASTGAETPEG
jgi:CheY-like chemotaxis protein